MYCPDCGKESKPGANFCRYCGSRLPAIPPRNAAEEDQPQTIPKKQTSTRHTAYFLLGMIALCAVSVLAIVLASMQKRPEYRLQVREKSAQASSKQEVPAPAAETPASEASCAFEPSLEDETDKELRDQLIADDAAFFDAEMATRILGFNQLLQEQCHAFLRGKQSSSWIIRRSRRSRRMLLTPLRWASATCCARSCRRPRTGMCSAARISL